MGITALDQLTVAEREKLLKLAASAKLKTKSAQLPSITRTQRNQRIPLSFAQQRLWFLAQMESGEAYHISGGFHLTGQLNRRALLSALNRIVARHEALRTTFACIDGEPEQRIAAAEDNGFVLLEHDLRSHQKAEGDLTRLAATEAATPFDLEQGPLIRGRLIQLAENEHALLITMHHIISDGWSLGVLGRELSTLYNAFAHGLPDPLPSLEIQYADYAIWQRQWIEGATLQRQAAYWKTALAGIPALLDLPTDHPRPAQRNDAGACTDVTLDERLNAQLKALSIKHGTTPFMTLLAGWATLLARLSGRQDIVIGTPVANRARPEIANLIGFFVNTLAIRLELSGPPTVAQLLARVKLQTLAAQQHQDIPFEQVVELVNPVRSLAHSPIFQVMFTWETN